MVICQYFLKGECRFGDKCRYEHPSAKKKTVCPYFMNGSCRFGDKCRNEHPRSGGGPGFGASSGGFTQPMSRSVGQQWNSSYYQNRFEALSSTPRDTVFGGQQSRATDSEQTISQIQQTIKNDLETWERSKQWPLSCYTYTKEEPSLQGLLDFSPEEIRLEAYTANAKGSAEIYAQGLKQLISENHKRRQHLSKMTVSQIQEEIKNNSRLPGPMTINAGSSMQQTSTGMFGGSGSFGQQGHTDGSRSLIQSSGLFGAGNLTSNQSGMFGQASVPANSGSVFGGSGLFGQPGHTDGSSSLIQSSGLFGNHTSNQSGTFGETNAPVNSGSVFGGQTSGVVRPANPSGSLFAISPAGQSHVAGGLFGSASPPATSSTASKSVDMPADSLKPNLATSSSAAKSSGVVSSTERQTLTCSEQDREAFMADSFVLGKIPECPPPLELC